MNAQQQLWNYLMLEPASAVCRTCMGKDCESLGVLPGRREFAGVALVKEMPGGSLYRCNKCNLVFRSPILPAAEYNKLYERASAQVWVNEMQQLRMDQSLVKTLIENRFPSGAKILDVGCYTGDFLMSLLEIHSRYGIEKSTAAARVAEERGIQILRGDIYEVDQIADRFDVITAMDVIEHMTHPDVFIKNMLTALTKTGILIITTGDASNSIWRRAKCNFWYCSFAEHISFISEDWLNWNAQANNFQVTHLQKFRYEQRSKLKTFAKLSLIHLSRLIGKQIKASWTAHVSDDHLLVVISRQQYQE